MSTLAYDLKIKYYYDGRISYMIAQNPIKGVQGAKVINDREKSKISLEDDIARSLRRSKQAAYDIVHNNQWEYFLTITFNGRVVDRYNYEEVAKKLSKTLNNIKTRKCPTMEYILVPELHDDGAIHFHGLLNGCTDDLKIYDSGKKDSQKRKIYKTDEFEKLGFTDLSQIRDSSKAGTYILKYMTKTMGVLLEGKKYWSSRGLNKLKTEKILIADPEQKKILIESLTEGDRVVVNIHHSEIRTDEYTNSYTYIVTQPAIDTDADN